MKGVDTMKKWKLAALAVMLAALVTLTAAAVLPAHAEEVWRLEAFPDLTEAEGPAPFRVAYLLPVKLNWETVYRDETLHTYAFLPNSAENIVAVLLTDGARFVQADLDQRGYATLYLTFETGPLRLFRSQAVYLVFIEAVEGSASF